MSISLNAAKLKQLREDRHWSQEHLAELAGIGVRTVQRIENGEKASNESLMALAAAFNIATSDLTEDRDEKDKQLAVQRAVKIVANMRLGFGVSLAGYLFVMLVFAAIGFGDGSGGQTMIWPAIWCTVVVAGYGLVVVLFEFLARHKVGSVSETRA